MCLSEALNAVTGIDTPPQVGLLKLADNFFDLFSMHESGLFLEAEH